MPAGAVKMPRRASLSVVYIVALLFLGLGYIAMMPLFEGVDETAHFSSMRQIADTKTIPVYGGSYLDKEVLDDYQGPVMYGSLAPPFDTGMVYAKFFRHPELSGSYAQRYREPHPHASFAPDNFANWQAQHPPLYYLIMAPVERVTDHASLVAQVFWLRFASYLIALAGVAFAVLAVWQMKTPGNMKAAMTGFLLYPVLFPGFFPEFARMGNDSLCIFWTGLIVLLLSRWRRDQKSYKYPIAIGIVLGLGLVTKIFFVLIAAALVLFLLLRIWRYRSRQEWRDLVCVLLPAVLAAAGQHVHQARIVGKAFTSDYGAQLAQRGGLMLNLREHFTPIHFLFELCRGIAAVGASWIWAGTWSLVRPHSIFYLPLVVLAAWIAAAYLLELKRHPVSDPEWLPVWLFCVFGCGLLYFVFIGLALIGSGAMGGWYLHLLMPWTAPALGLGFCSIWQHRRARYALLGLCSYAVLFQAGVLWAQFALFTGFATKGDDKHYAFSDHSFCFMQIPQMIDRLRILGWPSLMVLGFAGGAVCGVWLLFAWRKSLLRTA
jgi:Dolichyl-phosphate-mannose-protein mannosyltransferase